MLIGASSNQLISSAEDSHANPSVSQESAKASMMNDGSGLSLFGALAYYDHATSSLKMCQESLLPMMDAPSPNFYGTWPHAGTMRNGIVFQQASLVPLTIEKEYGFLPTPLQSDGTGGGICRTKRGKEYNLRDWWANQGLGKCRQKRNPLFGEWVMGYPAQWTELVHSATPSSHKSSNGLEGRYFLNIKDGHWMLKRGKTYIHVKPINTKKVSRGDK